MGRSAPVVIFSVSAAIWGYSVVERIVSFLVQAWFQVGLAGTVSGTLVSEPVQGLPLEGSKMPAGQSKTYLGDGLWSGCLVFREPWVIDSVFCGLVVMGS